MPTPSPDAAQCPDPFPAQRALLAAILVCYVLSRTLGVVWFVPHNDEVIYTQEAQLIAQDWSANRYLTVDGRQNGDYRPPLLYWLGASSLSWFDDPLRALRVWSVVGGLLNVYFFQRLVARAWGGLAAVLWAGLITASALFLYVDSVGLNEGLLAGLGAAFLCLAYEALARPGVWVGAGAVVSLAAMLTVKDAAVLWLIPAGLLPLLVQCEPQAGRGAAPGGGRRLRAAAAARLGIIVVLAFLLHACLVPPRFDSVRSASPQAHMVRSFPELATFPWGDWLHGLAFYQRRVLALELPYLTIPLLLAVLATVCGLWRHDRRRFPTYVILCLMYLGFVLPLIVAARVLHVRYFVAGMASLYGVLAITVARPLERLPPRWQALAAATLLAIVFGLRAATTGPVLLRWGQTDLGMSETPYGPSNGLGIPALLAQLEALEPGLVVLDDHWGLPGTAVQVYRHRYPQLRLQLVDRRVGHRELAGRWPAAGDRLYLLFDARTTGQRPWYDAVMADPNLDQRRLLFPKRYRDRELPDSRLVLVFLAP
ncbi:MAG: hypothetical protein NZ700_11200 [Gemmataceae bacterium]|nr:hypothetical protein [Gemmataceae bacterium]MDW8267109.1 hypothetical protein [Gemmataceae bacterium]